MKNKIIVKIIILPYIGWQFLCLSSMIIKYELKFILLKRKLHGNQKMAEHAHARIEKFWRLAPFIEMTERKTLTSELIDLEQGLKKQKNSMANTKQKILNTQTFFHRQIKEIFQILKKYLWT